MAIWIKTPPDAEPVWMAADNRIRELALSIERHAGIAPDADGLRKIRRASLCAGSLCLHR